MPVVTVQPGGQQVPIGDGETVLAGLFRAGYAYTVGCRRGGCGICKADHQLDRRSAGQGHLLYPAGAERAVHDGTDLTRPVRKGGAAAPPPLPRGSAMPPIHRITIEPVGRVVDCREDQTILDACLRAGVWVPHSCTHGTCATCKAEVLDGDVEHGASSSFALMDFERDEGRALLCCATPRSDVVIEADVDVDEDVPVHPVRDYTGTVLSIDDIAAETRRIMVELDRDLAFNAGQYMSWQVPFVPGLTRTYSLANPPMGKRLFPRDIYREEFLDEGDKATGGMRSPLLRR